MTTRPARHRSKAASRARSAQPLSEQDITDSALRLIARNGIDKLSMRTLASELGVTPMAIYYYVPNKEALLDLLADAVLSQVPTPPPIAEDWQAQLRAQALAFVDALAAYPGLSSTLLARPRGKRARELTRHGISILLAAGFDARHAALAMAAYGTYFFGAMSWQAQLGARRGRARPPRRAGENGEPMAAVARHLQELSMREWIEFGIDTVIAGLSVQLAQATQRRASPSHATAARSSNARRVARD